MKQEPRRIGVVAEVAAFLLAATLAIAPVAAQQITGVPGSPGATTTIDGNQLPPPPPTFGGEIKESAKDSKTWWPPRVVPPKGAPNVLLIMTDDQGYGVYGTFGGVIPTPALDRVAKAGLRYTQFNSTALCSPTRAALITGRNHHAVGFGVIAELSTGYPGYDSIIGPENATIGTILRDNGYATSWFGKNHNTPGFQYSVAGPYDQANANTASTHKTQYFEMVSNRGIYHEGWYANTTPPVPPWVLNAPMPPVNDYTWEPYNLNEDYSQANDLVAKMPGKLKEMQALFVQEAAKYNVLPLDNSQFARAIAPRPSPTAGQTVFTYLGEMPGIPTDVTPNILNKSFTITAEVEVPQGGGDGMIVTTGGRWGGYGLYLLKGKPVFNYNLLMLLQARWAGDQPLEAGKHTIVFDFTY